MTVTIEKPLAHMFDPTGSANGFPRQTTKALTEGETFAGELRGYYPGNWWKPKSSRIWGRGTPEHKEHQGWDIYAPYFPFPLETPVYAILSGRVELKSGTREADGLGNRIFLTPSGKGTKTFIYGHLNRFAGRFKDAKVKQGDLLGYAGCTGNADEDFECSEIGPKFNLNSGHVHLQIIGETQKDPTDQIPSLGWRLRFGDDETMTPEKFAEKHGKLPEAPKKSGQTGRLKLDRRSVARPAKTAAAMTLTAPHDLIDLDDKALLNQTANAYAAFAVRLSGKGGEPHRARGIKALRKSFRTLKAMMAAMEEQETRIQGKDPLVCCAETLRFLVNGYLVLWHLFGGPAALATLQNIKDEKTGTRPTDGVPPACGIAMNGWSWVIAADQGAQAALHFAELYDEPGPALRKEWTFSVSFGAGTEWHAVFDTAILGKLDKTSEPGKLVELTVQLASQLARLSDHVVAHHGRLNRGPDDAISKNAYVELIARVADINIHLKNIAAITEDLRAPADAKTKLLRSLLEAQAETGKAACKIALLPFDPKKKDIHRVTPVLSLLSFEPG
jgi:hypothetical protein